MKLGQRPARAVGHQQLQRPQRLEEARLYGLAQIVEAGARGARRLDSVREAEGQLAAPLGVQQVNLVEREHARRIACADLVEHLVDGGHHQVHLLLRHRGVDHVQDQVGAEGLLQRRRERLDELVRQLADEADRVRHEVLPARDLERARGRVERVEEALPHAHLRACHRVQKRGLARVGVAGQRHTRQTRAVALAAHGRARGLRLAQATAQRGDAVARQPAVGLDLGLARAPRADAAVDAPGAEALEVGPQPAHAREVVFELRQLDLKLALGRASVVGEDVEDDRRAVDHRHAELLLEVALLARQQLVVDGDQVGVGLLRGLPQLGQLAAAEVAVRIGPVAALDHLRRDRDSGGPKQLAELRQVGFGGRDADGQRALASTPSGPVLDCIHRFQCRGQTP